MKYAIAKWYITDFAIFEALDGSKYCLRLDWDLFRPNIAEPISCLQPITKKQTGQLALLTRLQQELDKRNKNSNLNVVSAEGQSVYLAANFPLAKIHRLSLDDFHSLSDDQALNLVLENEVRKGFSMPSIGKDYLNFLQFIVKFKCFSAQNILRLYNHSPDLSCVKTIGEWLRLGLQLQEENLDFAIPLPITITESFFERHGQYYPIGYAVQSERTRIQTHQLQVSRMEKESLMLMIDQKVLVGTPAFLQRRCDPQQLFEVLSNLSKTQGIEIRLEADISDSFYSNKKIFLPTKAEPITHTKQLCREYAAALVHETLAEQSEQLLNLYSDSLAWMLAYQYGLEEDSPQLAYQWWNTEETDIDLLHLTSYLQQALCYINQRIVPHLITSADQKQTIEENFFAEVDAGAITSNASKFTNKKGAVQ